MKIYITDEFAKFMKKSKLSKEIIIISADEISRGLHDGDLDLGRLFKKRIPFPKQSKRDSNRSIVAVVKGERMFFIDGWRKSDVSKTGKEIPDNLFKIYRKIGDVYRNMTDEQIKQNIRDGLLQELING